MVVKWKPTVRYGSVAICSIRYANLVLAKVLAEMSECSNIAKK